jgi:prophage DNA circulation protein
MPAPWAEFLQECSWAGVTFLITEVRDEFSRVLDRQELPGRDGASIEDRGRGPRSIAVRAVFIEESYPDAVDDLVARIAEGGVRELVHPVHGSLQAAVDRVSWVHTAEERDSAAMDLVFVEHTDGAAGPFVGESLASAANRVRSGADEGDVAATAFQSYLDQLSPPPTGALATAAIDARSALALAVTVSDGLEFESADLAVTDISARVNGAITELGTVIATIADFASEEAYELSRVLISTTAALERVATMIIESRPPLIDVVVDVDTPLLVWVHARYRDPERAEEVLRLNSIPDPLLIPAGTTLRAYAS